MKLYYKIVPVAGSPMAGVKKQKPSAAEWFSKICEAVLEKPLPRNENFFPTLRAAV
jgi:hypothetical protein